jgi:hypothetical protein
MTLSLRSEISKLWGKLATLYGAAFTKPYGVDIDKNGVWHQALLLVSEIDIEYGFKKLILTERYKSFPPNPLQFRELCIRSDKRAMPSLKDAYLEAQNFHDSLTHVWSHHAVKFCAIKTRSALLKSDQVLNSWLQFKDLYEKVSLAVNGGLKLPKISDGNSTEQANNSVPTKTVGQFYLAKIKKTLSKGVH